MAKFRKKPVVIEAVEFTGNNQNEIREFLVGVNYQFHGEPGKKPYILIKTLEGLMRGDVGDRIIKGVNDEFYPCKPDIFEKTYEAVT